MQNSTKLRGRPRAYDPETALTKMGEVFWTKGYAATSLDDLSTASGMNRPSLYNAFGEKADVFRAVLVHYADIIRPRYEAAFLAPGSLRDTLRAVFDTAFEIYREFDPRGLGCMLIGAALTDAVRDTGVGTTIRDQLHEMDKGFLWRLKKAQREGELKPEADVKALAMMASAAHSTLSVRMRAGATDAELRAFVDQMIGLICGF